MRLEMIAAIVLAAGASKRLGQPKQLVKIGGETLLQRTVQTAEEAGCAPIVVVLGAFHKEILAVINLHQVIAVINSAWQEGMASSVRLGIRAVFKSAEGAVLLTCDQPAVSPAHLRLLMTTGNVTASAYAGRQGVPAYFPASMFPKLLELHGDAGARELLHSVPAVSLHGGELDVDTVPDLEGAKQQFG